MNSFEQAYYSRDPEIFTKELLVQFDLLQMKKVVVVAKNVPEKLPKSLKMESLKIPRKKSHEKSSSLRF